MFRPLLVPALAMALAGSVRAQDSLPEPPEFPYRLTGILGGDARFVDAAGKPTELRAGGEIGGYVLESIGHGGVVLRKGGEIFRVATRRPGEAPRAEDPAPERGYPWEVPAWRRDLRRRLAETRLTLDVRDEALERVLERLQEASDIPIKIDPRVYLDLPAERLRLTLTTGVESVADLLELVLAGPGLDHGLEEGAVVVAPAGALAGADEAERVERGLAEARARLAESRRASVPPGFESRGEQIDRALRETTIPASLTGRPFSEIADELFALVGAQVGARGRQREVWRELSEIRIPADLAGQPIGEGVERVLAEKGLACQRVGNSIMIGKGPAEGSGPAARSALFDRTWKEPAQGVPLREFAEQLRLGIGVPVYPAPELWAANPTIASSGGEVTLAGTLTRLEGEHRIHGVLVEDALYLIQDR